MYRIMEFLKSLTLCFRECSGSSHASKYSAGKRTDARPSQKECRVYVGNLAYEVGWQDLKDFMRKGMLLLFLLHLSLPIECLPQYI
jgi:hypothetical protein